MLIDSNIIIYAAQSEHTELREFIAKQAPSVSAVSYIEVVGYHKLTEQDRQLFEAFFSAALVLPISQNVIQKATELRQKKKMSLGDALIAGTVLAHNLTLVTRNESDFSWIPGLKLINPFASENKIS